LRDRAPGLPRAAGLDSPEARFRVFDSLRSLLDALAGRAPIVAILDDLHGADQPSLILLEFMSHYLHTMPVLVVGTNRDASAHLLVPVAEMLAETLRAPGTERLTLSGFSETEVARFIEWTVGLSPTPGFVAAIHRRTEGNPLFLTEVIRVLLAEAGESALRTARADIEVSVPATVHAAIGQRLAPLSPECHATLCVAAVIGREFRADVLDGAMAALPCAAPGGDAAEAAAAHRAAALVEAMTAGVITRASGAAGRYRFAHALIRDALYEELEADARAALHRRVGEAIDQEKARALLDEALATAREVGMPALENRIAGLQSSISGWTGRHRPETLGPPAEPTPGAALFRKEGEYWTIAYAGSVVRLRGCKGLQYIASLLRHPRQEFLALDLIQGAGLGEQRPETGTQRLPLLDVKARTAYRQRLAELREELDEAERNRDSGRRERVRQEMDFVGNQLTAAVGLGRRSRTSGTDAERARSALTKRIGHAVRRIQAVNPALARHLRRTIKTGIVCAYLPDLDERVSWRL
jgi:hypothetical protein